MAAHERLPGPRRWKGSPCFALNQGEGVHLPVAQPGCRPTIYDEFLELVAIRTKAVRQGDPLDTEDDGRLAGLQRPVGKGCCPTSRSARTKAPRSLPAGNAPSWGGGPLRWLLRAAPPSSSPATTRCGSSKRRFFGPVVSVRVVQGLRRRDSRSPTTRSTALGAGGCGGPRRQQPAYRAGRDIQAGRVWVNCYPRLPPQHAAFGGYKQSGFGRENHKMMLDHYQQTKNLMVSYSQKGAGFLLIKGLPMTPAGDDHFPMPPKLLAQLQDKHGPPDVPSVRAAAAMGRPPMWLSGWRLFIVGDRDVLLGTARYRPMELGQTGCRVWIFGAPIPGVEAHQPRHRRSCPGRGGGFSLEAPEGVRFFCRAGRAFSATTRTSHWRPRR